MPKANIYFMFTWVVIYYLRACCILTPQNSFYLILEINKLLSDITWYIQSKICCQPWRQERRSEDSRVLWESVRSKFLIKETFFCNLIPACRSCDCWSRFIWILIHFASVFSHCEILYLLHFFWLGNRAILVVRARMILLILSWAIMWKVLCAQWHKRSWKIPLKGEKIMRINLASSAHF